MTRTIVSYIASLLLPAPGHEGFADGKVAVHGGDTEEEGAEVRTKHLRMDKDTKQVRARSTKPPNFTYRGIQ